MVTSHGQLVPISMIGIHWIRWDQYVKEWDGQWLLPCPWCRCQNQRLGVGVGPGNDVKLLVHGAMA